MTEALARLDLPRLTIDVDGLVIRTGVTVGWAFRGFNPHHRKDPSSYPLVAHVAKQAVPGADVEGELNALGPVRPRSTRAGGE